MLRQLFLVLLSLCFSNQIFAACENLDPLNNYEPILYRQTGALFEKNADLLEFDSLLQTAPADAIEFWLRQTPIFKERTIRVKAIRSSGRNNRGIFRVDVDNSDQYYIVKVVSTQTGRCEEFDKSWKHNASLVSHPECLSEIAKSDPSFWYLNSDKDLVRVEGLPKINQIVESGRGSQRGGTGFEAVHYLCYGVYEGASGKAFESLRDEVSLNQSLSDSQRFEELSRIHGEIGKKMGAMTASNMRKLPDGQWSTWVHKDFKGDNFFLDLAGKLTLVDTGNELSLVQGSLDLILDSLNRTLDLTWANLDLTIAKMSHALRSLDLNEGLVSQAAHAQALNGSVPTGTFLENVQLFLTYTRAYTEEFKKNSEVYESLSQRNKLYLTRELQQLYNEAPGAEPFVRALLND